MHKIFGQACCCCNKNVHVAYTQDIAAYRAKGGMGGGVKRGPGRPAVAGMAGRQAEPQDDDDEEDDDEEDDDDDDDDDDDE